MLRYPYTIIFNYEIETYVHPVLYFYKCRVGLDGMIKKRFLYLNGKPYIGRKIAGKLCKMLYATSIYIESSQKYLLRIFVMYGMC